MRSRRQVIVLLVSVLPVIVLMPRNLTAQNFPPAARASAAVSEAFVDEAISFSSGGSSDPDSGPAPLTFYWDFSDGADSVEPSPSHAFAAPGAYRVSLTVSDGADSDVAFATVFVLAQPTATKPSKSTPIAFSLSEQQLWMANPDSDSITFFDLSASNPLKIAEVPVGKRPRTVAVDLNGRFVFIACQEVNELWVLNATSRSLNRKIRVGHQPYGVAVSPVTGRVIVSNQGDDSVSIISPELHVEKVLNMNDSPRAIAISADGRFAFVSHFITRGGKGQITRINLTDFVVTSVLLDENPGPDTPSSSAGTPNILSALAVDPAGQYVWVGGLKSNSRRGSFLSGRPLTPENTVRGFFGPLAIESATELIDRRIDSNNADSISAIAFSASGRFAYVTHQGAEMLSVYDLATASMITPGDGTPIPFESRIDVGNAPQGILVSSNGQRGYVANFMSRDLIVLNLSDPTNPFVTARVASTTEPLPSSVANGKRLFYRSRAPRHSRDNYIACASCHADGGMDDGQTWDFTQRGEGVRNTIDLLGRAAMGHGPVHWSANFDEIQDFENDIVNQFGGTGLAQDGQPPHPPMGPPNAGRSQDLDDLAAYLASLTAPQKSPHRKIDGTLTQAALNGKALFQSPALQCAQCHAAPRFTDSLLSSNPGDYVFHDVGTLTPASGMRLGGPLSGLDTPTLFGLWNTAPYLHDGSVSNLIDVFTLKNPSNQHGVTTQLTSNQLADLVAYLVSIDGTLADELVDDDDDQMSDAWERLYGLDDADADPDNDGIRNYEEFLANTDPTDLFSGLRIREVSRNGAITLAVPTAKGLFYSLEFTDRIGDPWTNAPAFIGDGADIIYNISPSGSQKFYRVRTSKIIN